MKLAILVFAFALPLSAETGRFVARIDVRAGNIPADIIRSQSVLEPGRAYSDADLEIALARLRRLPFVYDARYAFEGDTLILTVDDGKRFFFDARADSARIVSDTLAVARLGGGGRLFVGRQGVLQLTAGRQLADGGNGRVVDAEYGHYFGRAFANLSVSQTMVSETDFDPTWRLTVGYPLTLRTTLTASAIRDGFARTRSFAILPRPLQSSVSRQTYEVRWLYDTTDDPYFTLRGLSVSAAPRWIREDRFSESFSGTTIFTNDSEGSIASFVSESSLFLPIRARSAFSSTLTAVRENGDYDERRDTLGPIPRSTKSTTIALSANWSHNFFSRTGPATETRHRLELGAALRRQKFESSRFGSGRWIDDRQLIAGYVVRHRAGLVRLNLAYVFD